MWILQRNAYKILVCSFNGGEEVCNYSKDMFKPKIKSAWNPLRVEQT